MWATRPIRDYVLYAGLWHKWSMFAPSPYSLNYDLRANVEFKDGSKKEWVWPRMEELSMWKRLSKERFRKWRELMFTDNYSHIWRYNARFVARQYYNDPLNPPVKVTLTRCWNSIPPPVPGRDRQRRPKKFVANASYVLGTFKITEKDLQ